MRNMQHLASNMHMLRQTLHVIVTRRSQRQGPKPCQHAPCQPRWTRHTAHRHVSWQHNKESSDRAMQALTAFHFFRCFSMPSHTTRTCDNTQRPTASKDTPTIRAMQHCGAQGTATSMEHRRPGRIADNPSNGGSASHCLHAWSQQHFCQCQ